jgi:hypothetical protein
MPVAMTDPRKRVLFVDALRLQLGRLEREAYGTPLAGRVTKVVALFEELEGRRPVAEIVAEMKAIVADVESKTCTHHSV